MTNSSNDIELTPAKSIWGRDIKVDLKPLFIALGKGVAHAATLKLDDLGGDVVDAVASLGLSRSPGELAFALIKRSAFDALLSLTRESSTHINLELCDSDELSGACLSSLENLCVCFDQGFFNSPGKSIFVKDIARSFEAWLVASGVAESSARSIASRYPAYFTFSLAKEWRENAQKYKPLLLEEDGPFAAAEAAENGWQLYFSFLRRRVSESVFDEPFGLSDIYVPLNAYYQLPKSKAPKGAQAFEVEKKRVCIRLHDEIRQWLEERDKADAIRVISGGPGSGKSSFTKMLCCELAESGLARPVYVPLHLIDPTRDVAQEVERFIRDEGLIGFNPLDAERKEANLLLVFDGLDELASTGKAAAQVARDFVQAVERMVERRNLGAYPIFVVLSGRELIVQENETEFRRPKQVLNVLPYHVAGEEESYVDNGGLLRIDLRDVWWRNYGSLIGRSFSGLPDEFKFDEIDEITSQPLLNYLVALSYLRGHLEFSERLNLNSVYADLVAAVHERAYEHSRTFRPISHLTLAEFVRVLEEIGLAAWHGSDGRSTSVRDIMSHCQQSGLESLLTSFKEGAQAGVTKLLAAFFFRRNGENVGDDAAFVFTHKSFGEYLTACRIVRGLERIVTERMRRRASADDGFDVGDALVYWLKLAGPAQMTEYLKTFLNRELMRRDGVNYACWQEVLQELMAVAVAGAIPVDKLGSLQFGVATRYEANASTALLIALNACASIRGEISSVHFSSDVSLGTFLRRICPQRSGPQSPLLYSALSYMDFSGQCLDMVDLYGSDLSHTKWHGCSVHFANFGRSLFSGADLRECRMSWSRFDSAQFIDVIISGVQMNQCVWDDAQIRNSKFHGVDVREASFSGAVITGCEFKDSNFAYSSINFCREVADCSFFDMEIPEDDESVAQWLSTKVARGSIRAEFRIVPKDELRLVRPPLGKRRSSRLVRRK